jgi:hypothetical protein
MRKGMAQFEYGQAAAAPKKGWPIDLLFPIFLVGVAYFVARFVGF